MTLHTSSTQDSRTFLAAINTAAAFDHWAYNPTTFKITPPAASNFGSLELELHSTSAWRPRYAAANISPDFSNGHSGGPNNWCIEEPTHFALVSSNGVDVRMMAAFLVDIDAADPDGGTAFAVIQMGPWVGTTQSLHGHMRRSAAAGVEKASLYGASIPGSVVRSGTIQQWQRPGGGPILRPAVVASGEEGTYRGVLQGLFEELRQNPTTADTGRMLTSAAGARTFRQVCGYTDQHGPAWIPWAIEYSGLGYAG